MCDLMGSYHDAIMYTVSQYLLVSENIELLEFTSGSWALRLAVARKGSLLCVPPGDCGAATEKKDVTGGAGGACGS